MILQTPKRRRVFALAILAIVIALPCALLVGFLGLLSPVHEEKIDDARHVFSQYEKTLKERPHLEHDAAELRTAERNQPGLMSDASSALSSASMQAEIGRLIALSGGEVRSSQDLPVHKESGLERIEVQYDFSLPQDGLSQLLKSLASHEPYFIVERLEIHADPTANAIMLVVRCKVTGFKRATKT